MRNCIFVLLFGAAEEVSEEHAKEHVYLFNSSSSSYSFFFPCTKDFPLKGAVLYAKETKDIFFDFKFFFLILF